MTVRDGRPQVSVFSFFLVVSLIVQHIVSQRGERLAHSSLMHKFIECTALTLVANNNSAYYELDIMLVAFLLLLDLILSTVM